MKWQPIETAPKDGSVILGCEWVSRRRGEHMVVEVAWDGTRWRLASTVWADESTCADPTHWMPRPAPPMKEGCRARLAPGQHWAFCGETDMGQTLPALCTECGGGYKRAT